MANRETFDAGSRHVDLGLRLARTLVSEAGAETESETESETETESESETE